MIEMTEMTPRQALDLLTQLRNVFEDQDSCCDEEEREEQAALSAEALRVLGVMVTESEK